MAGKLAKAYHVIIAVALGAAATLAVLGVHLGGLDRPAELLTLDSRFKHFSNAPQNERIVHIDIDDRSIIELGWPFQRAALAGIIQTLRQAGAESVALDIILPEPQQTRYESAATDLYSADTGLMLGDNSARPVFDDMLLRQTIRSAGRVAIPMHVNPLPPPATKLERQVEEFLTANPDADFEALRSAVFGDVTGDVRTEQFDVVRRGYLRHRGLAAMGRFALDAQSIDECPVRRGMITPPLVTFAQASSRSGFVTFDPDDDGVVRRIPMLAGDERNTYPQFALALAAGMLATDHGDYEITADASSLRVTCADGFVRSVPLTPGGQMLINWMPEDRESLGPMHIAADKVAGIWQMSQSIADNTVRKRLMLLELLSIGRSFPTEMLEEAYWQIVDLDKQLNETYRLRLGGQIDRERAILFAPNNVPPAPDGLIQREAEIEKNMDQLLEQFAKALSDPMQLTVFLGGAEATQADRSKAADLLKRTKLAAKANASLAQELLAQMDELRGMVADKLCIIGSVSTGAADFVPTPTNKRTPGVWVHSNILNTIVSGAFIRQSDTFTAALVIVAAGLLVTLLAATRPILAAGPFTVLLAGAYVGLNAIVIFGQHSYWLPMVAPLAAMFASLLIVTAFRQLTEERAKRQIRSMFAHALSPALVDRLIEDPSIAKLGGERRELTFFFSDLAGFTTLSERLGESGTVKLLNRYFDRMTEVIQNRRGGYLNKFLGDGLFVFFGAPVFQADHAARAIAAAVDCHADLVQLNAELAGEFGGSIELRTRIGISTGEVMVGNCGSSQRMDYTAIGDPVNLASRLESAGKFFGVGLLVSDEAWKAGGDPSLLARPFGPVIVVGKNEPVEVWHVLSRVDAADEQTRKAYADFAEAIELMRARKLTEAVERLEQAKQALGDDKPCDIFIDLCRKYIDWPSGDKWDGILRLAEK